MRTYILSANGCSIRRTHCFPVIVLFVVNLVAQRLYPTLERSGYGRIVAYRVLCRLLLAVVAGAIVLICWVFKWGVLIWSLPAG